VTIHLSDLSEKARKQLAAGEVATKKQPKKSPSSRLEGWCVQCSERIESEPAWDRHVAATGCRRRLSCLPLSTPPRSIP
jgi:hypothetical protein